MDSTSCEIPTNLLGIRFATSKQRAGLQQLATEVYVRRMNGLADYEIAGPLAADYELDSDETKRFVSIVCVHIRPSLVGTDKHKWISDVIWGLALMSGMTAVYTIKVFMHAGREILPEAASSLLVFAVAAIASIPIVASVLIKTAIRYRRKHAPDGLVTLVDDTRKPVIYLRSHLSDGSEMRGPNGYISDVATIEERICDVLAAHGPVIALEGPGEGLPNLGASRIRVRDIKPKQWQDFVLGLILRSSLVVVRFYPTEGVRWEVQQLLRYCPPSQLVFILTTPDAQLANRNLSWDELRSMLNGWTAVELPLQLGPDDFCLGFDSERVPRMFGRRSTLFSDRISDFSGALREAAGFSG